MLPYNKNLKPFARQLRNNMTIAEQLMWSKIRRKQIMDLQFYRQKNIGPYIVDFYCPQVKLIVEIDGGQHYEEKGQHQDRQRDQYLEKLGFTVLRFSNIDVLKNIDGALEVICERLKISPNPSLEKRGTLC